MTLFALSGFLGCKKDWEGISAVLEPNHLSRESLPKWAEQFNAFAKAYPAPRILMGYSLGGRKALHALLAQEELWSQAVFISTHPGLITEEEREERRENDQKWSERFLKEEWHSLLNAWNQQAVFSHSVPLVRDESGFDRQTLSQELVNFSLGRQRNLREDIAKLQLPILWVTGGKDKKFTELAKEIVGLHSLSTHWDLKEFGHRMNFQLIYDALPYKLPREVKNGHLEKDQRLSRHQI